MNKTHTINISGIIFHIDEFAYEKLKSYLTTIRSYFKDSDGRDEIMTDIESRIAEIFSSKVNNAKQVILMEDVDEYYEREVKPHIPESWMDREKDKVGYEINLTKYFYQYKPLRSLEEITKVLVKLEEESEGLFNQIING
jgi:hypothetical protein